MTTENYMDRMVEMDEIFFTNGNFLTAVTYK